MPDKYDKFPENANSDFATQAAAAEFGRNYIHPQDRDFQDRSPPNFQRPNLADQDVFDELGQGRTARPRAKALVA